MTSNTIVMHTQLHAKLKASLQNIPVCLTWKPCSSPDHGVCCHHPVVTPQIKGSASTSFPRLLAGALLGEWEARRGESKRVGAGHTH